MDSEFVENFVAAAKREVQTTLGRRYNRHLARSSQPQQQARPPSGAGLVVHSAEEDDGWDVVERVASVPRRHVVRARTQPSPPAHPASNQGPSDAGAGAARASG